MDSMGALALATEEPEDALLLRKPVGKGEGLVSPIMWRNILVQAAFQLAALTLIVFKPESLGFDIAPYKEYGYTTMFQSRPQYTILFNTFVRAQIFNEFNSRRLDNTPDCFAGIASSKIFQGVIVATVAVQFLFVEFGGEYTKTTNLVMADWIRTIGIASLTIPLGYLVRSQALFSFA